MCNEATLIGRAVHCFRIHHLNPVETECDIYACNAIAAVSVFIKFKMALGRIEFRAVGSHSAPIRILQTELIDCEPHGLVKGNLNTILQMSCIMEIILPYGNLSKNIQKHIL